VNIKAENGGLSSKGFILDPYKDTSSVTTGVTGRKQTFYGSVFYHFDRSTEVYLAADYMKLTDGWKDPRSVGLPKQTELAVGIRTRF
jgi:predicted porin